jgi:hypothetical protein
MAMQGAKVLIALGVLLFGGFGVYCLLYPAGLLDLIGADARGVDALNDVRAIYGGFELGIAGFLVACLLDRWSLRAGLWLIVATLGSAASARALSLFLDGPPSPAISMAGVIEGTFAAACVIALMRMRGSDA